MSEYTNYIDTLAFRLAIFKNSQLEADKLLSNKFNVYQYIHLDENKISDIIADLLNPTESHGQGTLFLTSFMKTLGEIPNINDYIASSPKIQRESKTTKIERNKRRMDILIDWNSYFAIGIENKPSCDDGYEQLEDYSQHLNKNYNGRYILIYLSESKPTEHSISEFNRKKLEEEKKYKHITYSKDIDNWLANCIQICQSEKFRYFLKDFKSILNKKFKNMPTSNKIPQDIIDYTLKSENNLEAAFNLYRGFSHIPEQIAKNAASKLKTRLENTYGKNVEINTNETVSNKINLYFRKNEWQEDTWCCIKDEDEDRVFFAVETNENQRSGLIEFIKSELRGQSNSQWLDYPEKPYRYWFDTLEGLQKMNGSEGIDYFFEYLQRLIESVDAYFLKKG